MFIRHQLSPYCIAVRKVSEYRGIKYDADMVLPAMHTPCYTPHGRNDYTGAPDDWGPDKFGYTDFDDYHLALYGA